VDTQPQDLQHLGKDMQLVYILMDKTGDLAVEVIVTLRLIVHYQAIQE